MRDATEADATGWETRDDDAWIRFGGLDSTWLGSETDVG